MVQRQEGLPASSLFALAAALFLFAVGGGLVGYMVGERQGEQRAAAIAAALTDRWEQYRGDATARLEAATGAAAARLEKAVADIRTEVSMYHGCGAICSVIAYQFGEELLHARDDIVKDQPALLPDWREALKLSAIPIAMDTIESTGSSVTLEVAYSGTTLIIAIALLCATVVLCFAIAGLTVMKLRAANDPAL